MRVEARAKLNLSLLVRPPHAAGGYHPIRSLALSIHLSDGVELVASDEDRFEVHGDAPRGDDNLAWQALLAVRAETGDRGPVHLRLDKVIPTAAGLGGGSADAAAALMLATELYGAEPGVADRLAPDLGADVPFCLHGGLAYMEGRGEVVTGAGNLPDDFIVGLVVPPFEMETGRVYAEWDRLDGPEGPGVDGRDLPPTLRAHAPLRNDLLPAAVSLRPELADWHADLRAAWGRHVMLSGSGPTLFGLFVDEDEALGAVNAVDGVRASFVSAPARKGLGAHGGTLP